MENSHRKIDILWPHSKKPASVWYCKECKMLLPHSFELEKSKDHSENCSIYSDLKKIGK